MKSVEKIFLEIIGKISLVIENKNYDKKHFLNKIYTNEVVYSKLKNYDKIFEFSGEIILENFETYTVNLGYYFSDKKSIIWINNNFDDDKILNYKHLILHYIDNLFNKYNIDMFIYNLII